MFISEKHLSKNFAITPIMITMAITTKPILPYLRFVIDLVHVKK